jgi:hypothetical protein
MDRKKNMPNLPGEHVSAQLEAFSWSPNFPAAHASQFDFASISPK